MSTRKVGSKTTLLRCEVQFWPHRAKQKQSPKKTFTDMCRESPFYDKIDAGRKRDLLKSTNAHGHEFLTNRKNSIRIHFFRIEHDSQGVQIGQRNHRNSRRIRLRENHHCKEDEYKQSINWRKYASFFDSMNRIFLSFAVIILFCLFKWYQFSFSGKG